MKLLVAENIGFCPGVRSAVERAEEALSRGGRTVCLGQLIHNREVTERLIKRGAAVEEDVGGINRGDRVIIRAHGVPPAILNALRERAAEIIDCTCPFVKNTQRIVERKRGEGYEILIAGEPKHPEVAGLLGYAGGEAIIGGSAEDFELFEGKKYCLVFQTTFDYEKAAELIKKIENRGIKTLEIFNTICYTTLSRQKEAKSIAEKCGAVLVVGDPKSSNTGKLLAIAKAVLPSVYLITELSDLDKVDKNIKNLGIITGASTSDELIMEVIFTMGKAGQSGESEIAVMSDKASIEAEKAEIAAEKAATTAAEKEALAAEKEAAAEEARRKAEEAIRRYEELTAKKAEEARRRNEDLPEKLVIKTTAEAVTGAEGRDAAETRLASEPETVTAEKTESLKKEDVAPVAPVAEVEISAAVKPEEKEAREALVSKDNQPAAVKPEGGAEKKGGGYVYDRKAAEQAAKHEKKQPERSARPLPVKKSEAAPLVKEAPVAPQERKPLAVVNTDKSGISIDMADVVAAHTVGVPYRPGKRVAATVISANENGVNVSIGQKKDFFIDKSEMSLDDSYDPAFYKEGDKIEAIVIEAPAKGATGIALSKKAVDKIKENERIGREIMDGAEFELVPDAVVKGGITGRYGSYTVFVPASQIKIGFVKNLEEYLGVKLRVKALPPKEREIASDEEAEKESGKERKSQKVSRFIVASQRVILEKERYEKEDEFWAAMQPGEVVNGTVKRFASFGAFVDVNGFDCLVHVSDISWNKFGDPSKVLDVNESYDFVVLKVDRDKGKVSLGYRQLQRKPYELAQEKFPVGSVVTGKVERIKDFGAFISLDDGVDGLVHVSQISHSWIKNANDVLKVGDEITAKVISFEENKITLSMKDLLEKPEFEEAQVFYGDESEPRSFESRENKFKKREAKRGDDRRDGTTPAPRPAAQGGDGRRPDSRPVGSPRPPVRKDGRLRQDSESYGQSEWVSSSSATTSLGDLFKDIKLDVE